MWIIVFFYSIYVIYRIITLIKTAKQVYKTKKFISDMVEMLGDIAVFFIILFYAIEYIGIAWHLSVLVMILCKIFEYSTKRE